jgi:hypothetical protein
MKKALLAVTILSLLVAPGCWFWQDDVTVHGPEGQKMKITSPKEFSINQGESKTLEIGIDRTGFSDPVELSLSGLPEGVTVDNASKTVETTKATFVVSAANDAPIVTSPVKLISTGPHGMEATQYIDFNVERP